MAHPTVLRVAKLATLGNVKASGEHTWRERPTENADPSQTHLNEDWRQVRSSAELVEAVQARVDLAQQKAERPVLCLEYLITAHHDAYKEGGGTVDSTAYFADSLTWLEKKHGKENIVAVNIQRDELTPHMVAYVVPLVEVEAKTRKRSVVVGKDADGKQIRELREYREGGTIKLSAAEFVNGREKLRYMQTDFTEKVGARHGLSRGVEGSKAKHQTVKEFYGKLNKAQGQFKAILAKANRAHDLENEVKTLQADTGKQQAQLSRAEREAALARQDREFLAKVLQQLPSAPAAVQAKIVQEAFSKLPSKNQPEKTPPQQPDKGR
jgi:hypothetical protein